jgi:hypothetical protein
LRGAGLRLPHHSIPEGRFSGLREKHWIEAESRAAPERTAQAEWYENVAQFRVSLANPNASEEDKKWARRMPGTRDASYLSSLTGWTKKVEAQNGPRRHYSETDPRKSPASLLCLWAVGTERHGIAIMLLSNVFPYFQWLAVSDASGCETAQLSAQTCCAFLSTAVVWPAASIPEE